MSRKHYVAIARALRETNASVSTCAEIANVCRVDNVRFDILRFMDVACAPGWNDGSWSIHGGFSGPEQLTQG